MRRTFTFSHNFEGRSIVSPAEPRDSAGTTLVFRGFAGERIKSYDDLRPFTIKQLLMEQFLPVFYERRSAGKSLRIEIELKTDESNEQREFFSDHQVLTEESLPQFKKSVIKDELIDNLATICNGSAEM
jgi:hypothetical protein